MNIKLIILINLLSFYGVCCDEETRELKVELNPGCIEQLNKTTCDEYIFVHVTAESEVNSIHYLYDFVGKPSVLIAKTPNNASLDIDWSKIKGNLNFLNFTSDPEYVFATVIKNIVVFNDTKGTSNYSDPSNSDVLKIGPILNWQLKNLTTTERNKVTLEVNVTDVYNGSLSLKFTAYGFKNHDENLPKLLHTADSMQIDIVANNIKTNFSSPRIAIELLMTSTEQESEGSYKMNRIRNLDDEFTPGIFDVYNLLTPRSDNNTNGGFIQYRPVCYTSHYRSVSSSTESRHGNPQNVNDIANFKFSLPYNFFTEQTLKSCLKEALNITFGMPDDGFYSRTNYIGFSFLMGLGAPASEGLSMFVKIFSAVGLGVPLLVLFFGGIYVAVKKYRN